MVRGLLAVAVLLCAGCSAFDWEGRRDALFERAAAQSWRSETFDAKQFKLLTLQRRAAPAAILTVYIEGDGRAWLDRSTPSANPTPERPVGLRLALSDPSTKIVYIGRPCQYLSTQDTAKCDVRYWTSHRYAPEVVAALSQAIDRHKTDSGAGIELIGYSGGGVLATLIAARRTDVRRIVTIAANLDLSVWTRSLGVDSMVNSLDPASEADRIEAIAQYHLAGASDEAVPPSVVRSYMAGGARIGPRRAMEIVPDYDHDCCWHRDWTPRIAGIRARLPIAGDSVTPDSVTPAR
jgi:pimeloyl-ACP methyl ester carboxylesterase